MPSVRIQRRRIGERRNRYLVQYRLGGRESAQRYAARSATRREASRSASAGSPANSPRYASPASARSTTRHDADARRSSRTLACLACRRRRRHCGRTPGPARPRSSAARAHDASTRSSPPTSPSSRGRCTRPAAKRETIRKTLDGAPQVLDLAVVDEIRARDPVHVRLPREEREEPTSTSDDQIEAVRPLNCRARTALAAAGPRRDRDARRRARGETLGCGDLDEPNSRWRVRRALEKGRRGRWVSPVQPDLFTAVLAHAPAARGSRARPTRLPTPRLRNSSERRSRGPARRPARRPGRRTTCATDESASGIAKARPGR